MCHILLSNRFKNSHLSLDIIVLVLVLVLERLVLVLVLVLEGSVLVLVLVLEGSVLVLVLVLEKVRTRPPLAYPLALRVHFFRVLCRQQVNVLVYKLVNPTLCNL